MNERNCALPFLWSFLIVVLTIGMLFEMTGCGNRLAGTGIETTNGLVVGRVVGINQYSNTEGVKVRLSEIYMTASGDSLKKQWTASTNKDGWYRFENVNTGRMVLTAENNEDTLLGIIPRIVNPAIGGIVIEDLPLQKKVELTGRVFPPSGILPQLITVCIPGMSACILVGADSTYTLSNAPRGKYDIVFILGTIANYLPVKVTTGWEGKLYLRDLVFSNSLQPSFPRVTTYSGALDISTLIVPKDYLISETPYWYTGKVFDKILYYNFMNGAYIEVATENLALWSYSKSITINSGVRFPGLVNFQYLIRLSGTTFDFSQAAPLGEDIRFSRKEKSLAYQIERWDSVNAIAEIWVQVDTLLANDSSLSMHWGRPAISSRSDGPSVFPKVEGYLGVWHLGESHGSSIVSDGSGNQSGKFISVSSPPNNLFNSVPGIAGQALNLSGINDYVAIAPHPILEVTDMFTLSIWARNKQTFFPKSECLVSKWELNKMEWLLAITGNGYLELHFGDHGFWKGKWRSSSALPTVNMWHHYAATFSQGVVRLYADGEEIPSSVSPLSEGIPNTIFKSGAELRIGGLAPDVGVSWNGELDECKFSNVIRSPGWIHAEYLNQKP